MSIPSVSNIITQKELERTPGMAAVSGIDGREKARKCSSTVTHQTRGESSPSLSNATRVEKLPASLKQIPGVFQGTESPGSSSASYLEQIANVVQDSFATVSTKSSGLPAKCPGYFVVGRCENGHRFAKELYCGREWCPVCGEDKSAAHMRRFARWVGKAQQLTEVGYLVFTLPEQERGWYRSKAKLNELTKRVTAGDKSRHIEGLLKGMGFERGLARWHWFGETPGKWHPHLNVIIEAGRLTPGQLTGIRRAWAGILGVDVAVVNYSYTAIRSKMVHILKYVTRATFREYTWDERMAGRLYNFRNMRSWGTWSGPPVWEMKGKAELEPIAKLEAGQCPVCGEPVSWARVRDIAWLRVWVENGQAEPLGAGYWKLGP